MAETPSSAGAPANETGHDKTNGRFTAGNRGGPGNPYSRHMAEMRRTMHDCVTRAQFEEVVRALTMQAAMGDLVAIKLFLQYMVGLPLPGKNPDEADLDDWKLRAARPSDGEAKEVILQRQPLDTVLVLAEVVDGVNHEKAAQQARDAVAADARKASKRARRQARRAERLAARAEKKARGDGAEAGESAERRGQETRAEREERRGQ